MKLDWHQSDIPANCFTDSSGWFCMMLAAKTINKLSRPKGNEMNRKRFAFFCAMFTVVVGVAFVLIPRGGRRPGFDDASGRPEIETESIDLHEQATAPEVSASVSRVILTVTKLNDLGS